jgi:VanZ family protein
MVHFTMYGVFAALLGREAIQDMGVWRGVVVAALCAAAFGAMDEWHQRFIPDRSMELADWGADSFGALVGAGSAAMFRRMRASRIR